MSSGQSPAWPTFYWRNNKQHLRFALATKAKQQILVTSLSSTSIARSSPFHSTSRLLDQSIIQQLGTGLAYKPAAPPLFMADTPCTKCKKTAAAANMDSLKACGKCKTARYCSRECQTADWKVHKKVCGKEAAFLDSTTEHSSTYSAPRLKGLEKHIPNPFTKLDQGKFLHERPKTDVYKLLIDSFRMRQADDKNFEDKTAPQSIYTGASSSIKPFRKYLAKASARPNVLPPWWNAAKQTECEAFGESGAWSNLRKDVNKQDIIDHYGDQKTPMQFRMLAEVIYGVGVMGQDGTSMRRMMMETEKGGSGMGGYMSMFSLNH
jgi:splicing suppressor protein 51